MNRPPVRKYIKPKHISDYPVGPSVSAGYLTSDNSGWRTLRPVIDNDSCTGCLKCYLCCPEGVIYPKEGKIDIDYDFCKGCGICSKICRNKVIKMEKEKK